MWGHAGCENFCAGVLIELFWCEIYSAKSMPYPGHQYGSCSCWGMWRQAPWIMQEYELVNMIEIWTLTQPRTCERIYQVLPSWVESNLWVWLVPPSRACNLLIGQTLVSDSAYNVYLYFTSTIYPGAFPFFTSYRCLCTIIQIWRQLCHKYGLSISSRWGRHLCSPICVHPDVPPPLIFYGPCAFRG